MHLLIITKTNKGRITQKTKKLVTYKGWTKGAEGIRRELYFSEYAFLIGFDFRDHVNVLHIQKIKSIRMGRGKTKNWKQMNLIVCQLSSITTLRRKYNAQKFIIAIFKFVWPPTRNLGQGCRGTEDCQEISSLQIRFWLWEVWSNF